MGFPWDLNNITILELHIFPETYYNNPPKIILNNACSIWVGHRKVG